MNLKNQSNEMSTIVETFIIEETASLIYDGEKLDNWHKKCEELGLTGQAKITHTKDHSPIPFMHLKTNLVNVLKTLCPRAVSIEQYDVTPIPLEILDLVALSKKEQYFSKVQIWYDEKSPDPVCVGVLEQWEIRKDWSTVPNTPNFKTDQETKDYIEKEKIDGQSGENYSNAKYYLLGKWADVKHSFEELTEMASKRFKEFKANEYHKDIKKAQRGLDDLENEAFDLFRNGNTNSLPF